MKVRAADYLPALDGWRAVAILMVVFCHLRLPGSALRTLAPYGAMGVHLFFAISGFLITHRLLEEYDRSGRISLRSFYVRRAFRILPAAFAYLLTLCLLGFASGVIPLTTGQIVSSALFFRNYWVEPAAQSWYTGHFWSLSVEEHFYLLWPGLLVLIGLRRARWFAPALACSFALWRALDSRFGWIASIQPAWKDLVERSDYRMDGLLWGCAAALVWRAPRVRARLEGRGNLSLIAVAIMVLLLIVRPPGSVAMLALLMPVPILLTAADANCWMTRALDLPPALWLGRLSYSVYIWQMLFLPAYGIPISLGTAQRLPWNVALIVALACISYYAIERPLRRIGRRLAQSSGAKPVIEIPA